MTTCRQVIELALSLVLVSGAVAAPASASVASLDPPWQQCIAAKPAYASSTLIVSADESPSLLRDSWLLAWAFSVAGEEPTRGVVVRDTLRSAEPIVLIEFGGEFTRVMRADGFGVGNYRRTSVWVTKQPFPKLRQQLADDNQWRRIDRDTFATTIEATVKDEHLESAVREERIVRLMAENVLVVGESLSDVEAVQRGVQGSPLLKVPSSSKGPASRPEATRAEIVVIRNVPTQREEAEQHADEPLVAQWDSRDGKCRLILSGPTRSVAETARDMGSCFEPQDIKVTGASARLVFEGIKCSEQDALLGLWMTFGAVVLA